MHSRVQLADIWIFWEAEKLESGAQIKQYWVPFQTQSKKGWSTH